MDRTNNIEMEMGETACTEIEKVMGLMFPVL
jgi:hypothetical protein